MTSSRAKNPSKNRDAFQAETEAFGEALKKKEWQNAGTGKNACQSSSMKMPKEAAEKELIHPGMSRLHRDERRENVFM